MMKASHTVGALAATALLAGWAAPASAQVARISGIVRDEGGQPIKGATIRAENPDVPLVLLTAATDDKGRFAIIGLARGSWMFTVEAPGYQPQYVEIEIQRTATPLPPLVFGLQKAQVRPPAGIEGVTARDLQQQLESADALYRQQKFEEAIAAYRAVLRSAPSLAIVNLQIGAAYRSLKNYDAAIAAYDDLLKAEPENAKAQVGLALAYLDKGDRTGAEQVLARAASGREPGREVFYELGELKRGGNQSDEALAWYQKAAAADSSWAKPLVRIGSIAMARGDREAAAKALSQAVAVDPTSPEAAEARTLLDRLR